jgi:hypothetical protein
MKPKRIEISCPIFFTTEDANLARIKSLQDQLPIHDKKMLPRIEEVEFNEQYEIAKKVVSKHDVKYVDKLEKDGIYEIWYYGITKVKQRKMVIYMKFDLSQKVLSIEASGENHENITALLAELESQIRDEIYQRVPEYDQERYYDIKTTVVLGHCPFCFNPVPKNAVAEYNQGKPIKCRFCDSNIDYYQ